MCDMPRHHERGACCCGHQHLLFGRRGLSKEERLSRLKKRLSDLEAEKCEVEATIKALEGLNNK